MKIKVSGHSVYKTEYHIVWIPKYRRRILNPGVKGYLKKIMPKILEELPGCEIIEQNIQVDHIHTVMIIPPKYAVSDVIGRIKQKSASMLRKKLSFLKEVYRGEPMLWSPGYLVSTVGIDEAKIIKYVQWQDRQDSGQTKFE